MTDEKVGQVQLLTQVHEKVEYLGLDGNIQCSNRFITNKKLRLDCQCTGHPKALSLPSGKLMGIA